MPEFLNSLVSLDISVLLTLLVFLCFIILCVFFIVFQTKSYKKICRYLKDGLSKTQAELFTSASGLLAKQLTEYTDRVLVEKIDKNYEKLISEDLLPSVNLAAARITQLSEAVAEQQLEGMKGLAVMLADLMSERIREYISSESAALSTLDESVRSFSADLNTVALTMNTLASIQDNANEQIRQTCLNVAQVGNLLSERVAGLKDTLHATEQAAVHIQMLVVQNSETVAALAEKSSEIQLSASQFAAAFSEQSERTDQTISNAISSMQQNTELAAKALVSELSLPLNSVSSSISDALTGLNDITEKIELSSVRLADEMNQIYGGFHNSISASLSEVTSNLSQSVSAECQKIILGAHDYSVSFVNSINSLNVDLDKHISNLQTITEQLNHNVSTYKNDVELSSRNFETGMEKSVSAALSQMDAALAQIVGRLVDVTLSIHDAADALPKAINAFKKEE